MDYNNISHLHNFQLSQDTYNAFYNLTNAMISIYLIIDHLFITNSYLMYNLYLSSIDSLHSNICTSLYIPKSLYTLSTNSPLFHLLTGLHSSTITHSFFKRTSHSMQQHLLDMQKQRYAYSSIPLFYRLYSITKAYFFFHSMTSKPQLRICSFKSFKYFFAMGLGSSICGIK